MRYILGFLLTIGLIVLIIFLLLSGGGSKTSTAPKVLHLADYAHSSTTEASYLVDGPIVANQEHDSFKITVSQSEVTATLYQGYEQTPLRSKTYPSNSNAYAVFIYALNHASFASGDTSKALQDERGYCPTGQRTIYKFTDGTKDLMRFWHSSCGQGTFKGDRGSVSYLFQEQVPQADYQDLLRDTNIDL